MRTIFLRCFANWKAVPPANTGRNTQNDQSQTVLEPPRQDLWRFASSKKLVLSYVFLITLPILLFSAATVSRVATQLERSLLFSSNQIFDQTYDVISNSLDQVDAISDAIILNASIANTIQNHQKATRSMTSWAICTSFPPICKPLTGETE